MPGGVKKACINSTDGLQRYCWAALPNPNISKLWVRHQKSLEIYLQFMRCEKELISVTPALLCRHIHCPTACQLSSPNSFCIHWLISTGFGGWVESWVVLTPYEFCGWLGWGSSPCWWLHGKEGRDNWDLVCTGQFTLTCAALYIPCASQPGQE